ncbi:MAG: elongation factor G [Desulfovibrio sp.]
MSEALNNQRTYALVGHGGCGKTSVAEMLMFNAGIVSRLGKIEEGTTALDYEPEEIKRRGSIQPGLASYKWKKADHFLIDTPGDPNFSGDLPYLLTAADSVIFTVDAVDGAKPLTRKAWKAVQDSGLPSLFFINKMDRDRANYDMAFNSLSEVLGVRPIPLYFPIGSKDNFQGVVDMLAEKAYFFTEDGKTKPGDIPADIEDEISIIRETMIENIAESDEDLMEQYLEEGELTPEEITLGLSKGVLSGELAPVCVGSALENKGSQFLLDAAQALLPNPLQHQPWISEEGIVESNAEAPFSGFVFKTISDPFAGQLSCVRVLSGTVSGDTPLVNVNKDGKERIGQLLLMQGKEQAQCKNELGPGAIFTVAKLKNTTTGDTLCAEGNSFALTPPTLAPQLITYALSPEEKGDEDKAYTAINKLLDEDIALKLSRDEESADILISGMGQNHIEVSVERARRRSKVGITLKTPKVPYRETLIGSADVQGRHKKQSGGRGQFGDCFIKVSPRQRNEGYEFTNKIVGGSIPKQYIPAVDKGVQEAAARGYLAGCPIIDFEVTLYDGSYHSVDSSEMAFKIAGSLAFKKACEEAGVRLLEPIMAIHIDVPDQFMGDVIGDISGRRGKVLGSDSKSGITEIQAHVPMSEVLKYAPDLRSMTGGQGTFTMEFDHYEECPPQVADKVIESNNQE